MDHLEMLANEARNRVDHGFYEDTPRVIRTVRSLVQAIREYRAGNPVIAEVKYASPSHGSIRAYEDPQHIAELMVQGGACGLSVLTASGSFQGDVKNLSGISGVSHVPVLMKDIIISPEQLKAGARSGADAVVLIAELYDRDLADYTLDQMMHEARKLGLEVLLEACSDEGFSQLSAHKPDLYGVNNRDLSTFKVDLETTEKVLHGHPRLEGPIISESGIENAEDVRRLRNAGADSFLVGTSIMRAERIADKVRELVKA